MTSRDLYIPTIAELERVIDEYPDVRERLRRKLLTDEERQLPQLVVQFAEQVNNLAQAVAQLTARVDKLEQTVAEGFARAETDRAAIRQEMAEGFKRLETDVAEIKAEQRTMASQIGNLQGDQYERQIARRIRIFARKLGTRNPKILQNINTATDPLLQETIEGAEKQSAITESQADDILSTDLIFSAARRDNGETIYAAAEISVSLHTQDIERARQRADILTAAGLPAIPAVIGKSASDSAKQMALEQNVQIVPDEE